MQFPKSVLYLAVAAALSLSACGGGGSSTASNPPVQQAAVQTGVFLDSAVAGVDYTTDSDTTPRLTNAEGQFLYKAGETVTFKLGGVLLGRAKGADVVTLSDLDGQGDEAPRTLNTAQLLQALDDDRDPTNGIVIRDVVRQRFANIKCDLSDRTQLAALFQQQLADLKLNLTDPRYAKAHFEDSLSLIGRTVTSAFTYQGAGAVQGATLSVSKYAIGSKSRFNVPYPGDQNTIKAEFPKGFPISLGSGIALKGLDKQGNLEFWVLTDRGPNGDSPGLQNADGTVAATKSFPAPKFVPEFGVVTVGVDKGNRRATLESTTELRDADGSLTSGRPIPPGSVGSTGEIPVSDTLQILQNAQGQIAYDAHGLDPEAVVQTPDGKALWMTDEYGPFVFKVDAATGQIQTKLAPGSGLPDIVKYRQPNRGIEALALAPNGNLLAGVQSILKMPDAKDSNGKTQKTTKAEFTRLVQIQPDGATRMYAYPLTDANGTLPYSKNKDAKIGDLVALDDTRYLIIERGTQADGKDHNMIFIIDLSGAADLTGKTLNGLELEYQSSIKSLVTAGINPVKKTLLFDLVEGSGFGWVSGKTEGMALVDKQTIAVANDNDFGLAAEIVGPAGEILAGDDCEMNSSGQILAGTGKCTAPGNYTYRIIRGKPWETPSRLFLIKLPKPVLDYAS
ncbi:MAG: esterase-like activity of phytase family protein [Burkholderiaceae bacterium]|nr:esterase-like activity of phytase family protein [Burkholderiaceae bacterium]